MKAKGLKKSQPRPIFKNPNFKTLCELGKTWKQTLKPIFKNLKFESVDQFEKGIT